jgi:hypothetical protein
MRWSPLLSVVIGLSIATGRLLSQETPVDDGPEAASSHAVSLLRDGQMARFRLVLGQLELDPVRYRKGTQNRSRSAPVGDVQQVGNVQSDDTAGLISETLAIEATRGIPRLHYRRQSPVQTVALDIDNGNRILIDSLSVDLGERVVVTQDSGRQISIRRERDGRVEQTFFDTWFHLYIRSPELYRRHLAGLLDDMLYPMRLDRLAESALARSVAEIVRAPRPQVGSGRSAATIAASGSGRIAATMDDPTLRQVISRLGSSDRADRISAHQSLLQQGIAIVPRLRQIDPRALDPEQRERLAQVLRQLTPAGEDHEARVATLLRDDSAYWASAADRLTADQREMVAARIASLAVPTRPSGRGEVNGEIVAASPLQPDPTLRR